jgi:parallel beta-helix repeat protein
MQGKPASIILLFLLLVVALALAFNVQPVKSDYVWTEPIYIRADGSIVPSAAPISSADNVTYTLTDNITGNVPAYYSAIIIQRDNITIDGAGHTLTGTQASGSIGIELTGIGNVKIKDLNITAFEIGILLAGSSNNSISGNNIRLATQAIPEPISVGIGILLFSNYNNISENTIENTFEGIGIQDSSSNDVSGNTLRNNYWGIGVVDSDYVSISENIVTSGNFGIFLERCSNSIVSRNNVTENNLYGITLYPGALSNVLYDNDVKRNYPGIKLWNASLNSIYNNNFVDNFPQVNVIESGYNNSWDNGYASGGNYWSDYAGVDLYSGPHQNQTGSDGIGDTPYAIDANNKDNYPLMNLWPPLGTRTHDVAVTSVIADRAWVCQGLPVYVNVTVLNKGDFDENVTVTLYYNITANQLLGAQKMTISLGQNETVVFVWDTAGVPYCQNYTLTAFATIPADNNPADNTQASGPIMVRIMGDINGDGKVDGRDIILVARAFASYGPDYEYAGSPPSPGWNLDCDINSDNKVDGRDMVLVARNFGR